MYNDDFILTFIDIIFSCFIVGPAVVGYWRGTWLLSEHYIYHNNPNLSSWISLAIGCSLHLLFALTQNNLDKYINIKKTGIIVYFILSRIYTEIFSFACVNTWRGVWQTLEHYTGTELHSVLITTTAALVLLIILRTLRNLTSPPFALVLDLSQGYFKFPTMFHKTTARKKDDHVLHIFDCIFSVLIVGSLVVIVWRGTWGILDQILFPDNFTISSWISLGVGYTITALGFALQVPISYSCEKLEGTLRLAIADSYQFFCFCGTVNLWRGVWNLLNIYLLPEQPLTSFWLTHWLCLILLIALGCSNSLLVRGVLIDGDEKGGQCVIFQCNYLRHRYEVRKKDKETKEVPATGGAAATSLLSDNKTNKEINSSLEILSETPKTSETTNNDCNHIALISPPIQSDNV